MIRTLRWILVIPMAVAGWFIAFASAVTLHSLIWDFCPPEFQVSGMCTHPWAFIAEDLLVWSGAFVSAVLVVAFAARTAPSYKSQVATACLVIGVAVGTYSSIFVASPVLLWMLNTVNKRRESQSARPAAKAAV